jgi:hypothetical protein
MASALGDRLCSAFPPAPRILSDAAETIAVYGQKRTDPETMCTDTLRQRRFVQGVDTVVSGLGQGDQAQS